MWVVSKTAWSSLAKRIENDDDDDIDFSDYWDQNENKFKKWTYLKFAVSSTAEVDSPIIASYFFLYSLWVCSSIDIFLQRHIEKWTSVITITQQIYYQQYTQS